MTPHFHFALHKILNICYNQSIKNAILQKTIKKENAILQEKLKKENAILHEVEYV